VEQQSGQELLKNKVDLSRIRIRLENIEKKATRFVSFTPSDVTVKMQDFYMSPTMSCLEDLEASYSLAPDRSELMKEWNIYAYDESIQNYKALEGDLLFCSSSTIKIEDKYRFNLSVLPYFLTSMKKFKISRDEDIRYAENVAGERNMIMITSKIESILESIEPKSIVLIDGPLVGGNASSYIVRMDEKLRKQDCIPVYFVKNSDSRLVIETNSRLSSEFNSDFHWAACHLKTGDRSPFFKYTDKHNSSNSKVFSYMKALYGFPERVEMHAMTYEKYASLIPSLMNLLLYFYIVQGDYSNPQVRPIAIAEKYAREGLRMLNIPALLSKLGFRPTINQVRFGD
jgi:hypothetical protein